MKTGRGRERGGTGKMAEINICHDLAPSGSLLYPRSDDSAVEKSPHPETGPTGWV